MNEYNCYAISKKCVTYSDTFLVIFLASDTYTEDFLNPIVFGGKSNLIVLGGGADLPHRLFRCIKFKSNTNFMPIL